MLDSTRSSRAGHGSGRFSGKVPVWVAIADLVVLILGIASLQISYYYNHRNPPSKTDFAIIMGGISASGIAWALGAIGIITFFGVLATARQSTSQHGQERHLRFSIAAAFVAVYFGLLGTLVFFHKDATDTGSFPFASTVLTNFTALMVIVVGSFFGASALAERQKLANHADPSEDDTPPPGHPPETEPVRGGAGGAVG